LTEGSDQWVPPGEFSVICFTSRVLTINQPILFI
jgi:hypothetical protein